MESMTARIRVGSVPCVLSQGLDRSNRVMSLALSGTGLPSCSPIINPLALRKTR
jgi:hypothetical protein